MSNIKKIAIIGGGEKELSVLSDFHGKADFEIIGVYDPDPRAVAINMAEIIGIATYTDRSYIDAFRKADFVIADKSDLELRDLLKIMKDYEIEITDIFDSYKLISEEAKENSRESVSSSRRFEEALEYLGKVSDLEKLLKWLLEVSVEVVGASQGSIMLYCEKTGELYIGYAKGLSEAVIKETRVKLGEGISGKAATLRKTILTRDLSEKGLYAEMDRERPAIKSSITAPITHGETLLGVLNMSTNSGEKELDENDRDRASKVARRIAPVLHKHLEMDADDFKNREKNIREYLQELSRVDGDFHKKFILLSKFLSNEFNADTVSIYTATDEGDWLILGGSDNQLYQGGVSSRVHCIKGGLAKAYLDGEEVIMAEAPSTDGDGGKDRDKRISFIYLPLVNREIIGVLAIEFSSLPAQQTFIRHKDSLRFQLGLFIQSQLNEVRQNRRINTLEKLSDLTPKLIGSGEIIESIDRLPGLLSSLVNAAMGSFHFNQKGVERTDYFNFPDEEDKNSRYKKMDRDIFSRASKQSKAECVSFLTTDVERLRRPPFYYSVITYPMIISEEIRAIYIGYNRIPQTPIDSAIFGPNDIALLDRAEKILGSIYDVNSKEAEPKKPVNLEELLTINRNLLLTKTQDEIDRADRYHNSFTLTVFQISGLKELLEKEHGRGLNVISGISSRLRDSIRKTDYFAWIEPGMFTVLSLESLGRIKILEERLRNIIDSYLKTSGLYDPAVFHSQSSFSRFPGKSKTPTDLIIEARSGLDSGEGR